MLLACLAKEPADIVHEIEPTAGQVSLEMMYDAYEGEGGKN